MAQTPFPLNVKVPTLGGKQFWSDVLVQKGWRIQQNVFTGHHRLLDAGDQRQAWGEYEKCLARLRKARLTPHRGQVVVVLHGLFRTRARPAGASRRRG